MDVAAVCPLLIAMTSLGRHGAILVERSLAS